MKKNFSLIYLSFDEGQVGALIFLQLIKRLLHKYFLFGQRFERPISSISRADHVSNKALVTAACLFLLLFGFIPTVSNAQVTVTYAQQTGNYYTSTFSGGGCGVYNPTGTQVGMFANSPAPKQAVMWRKFRTDASNSSISDRAMQIGDQFVLTLRATRAYGRVGFALLASPATGTYANRESNYAVAVNLDGPLYAGVGTWGNWYIKYSGGATSAAAFGGQQGTLKDFTFTLTLIAVDRMNITMTDGTTTNNFYDIQLNSSNPITDYSIFLEDDYDGGVTQNVYWGLVAAGTQHKLTNTGALAIGQSNNTFTIAGNITNGLNANSSSLNNLNNTLTKSGTGNVTLSGTNVYAGNTNLNAGTLTIGAAAALSSSSKLVFNGGTLAIGNVGASAVLNGNTLNFQASSSINLGTSTSTFNLNFANSNAETWNAASTVTIFNWTPSAGKIINIAGAGLTPAQLAKINFDNYGVGAKFVANELRPALLFVTNGTSGGSYNTAASWKLADKPTLNNGTESIYVQPGDNLALNSPSTLNFLRAEVGGTLTMGTDNITIFPAGDFRISGTVSMTSTSVINMSAGISMIALSSSANFSAAGTLNFVGAFTITSTSPNAVLLPNVNLTASVDFGQNSTMQNGSALNMNGGGFINTNAPYYATGSTLKFNTTGTYGRALEWSATTGKGYPYNVLVTNSTTLDMGTWGGAATARQCAGSLTIDPGSTLSMNEVANPMSAEVIVLGNVNVNGTLKLGGLSGGDIYTGGDYTVAAAGSVINNGRATYFTGASGNQLITKTGGGTVFFDFFRINKASGDVQLNNGAGNLTDVQINSSTNNITSYVIRLQSGDLDLNGRTFTLSGTMANSTNMFTNGTGVRRIYTSTGTGSFIVTGTATVGAQNLNVDRASVSSSLTFDANVTLITTVGVDFGPSGMTLINSIFQINSGGFVINNSPDYGNSSYLVYNNGGGGFNRNMEWNTNLSGAGFPNNIIVQNSTPLVMDFYAFTAASLGCSGYIDIKSGSSMSMGTLAKSLSVGTDLTISGTLTLSTVAFGDLNVGGSWTRTGTFTQNSRNVTFNGSQDGILTATGGQQFSFVYLVKANKTNKLTLASNVSVTDEAGFTKGTLDLGTNKKFLSILSTSAKTARVAQSDSSNTDFVYGTADTVGQFIMQRYVPARRSWRLMSPPLKPGGGTHMISEAWQERGLPTYTGLDYTSANYAASVASDTISNFFGTHITGGATGNGFDLSPTNNPSIKFFSSGSWIGTTDVNATPVNSKEGWMLFLRGDRKTYGEITNQYKTPTITTLRPRGRIFIGRKSVTSSGMTVVGNPYASAIDFSTLTRTWGGTATYYVWDPYLGGATGQGAFVALTWNGTDFSRSAPLTGTGTSTVDNRYIASGGAIMVDFPAGGGTLGMAETDKSSASTTLLYRPIRQQVSTVLRTVNPDKTTYVSDGTLILFGHEFNNSVDREDAIKPSNFTENFGVKRDQKVLSIERRKLTGKADTIFYNLSKMQAKNYQLEFVISELDAPASTAAFLEDLYLKKKTPVSLHDTTRIDFKISVDAEAQPGRFRLVFRRSVTFHNIKAFVREGDIAVEWEVADEININHYEVERSTDGVTFKEIGRHFSKGNTDHPVDYSWLDASVAPAEYYYRVKSIDNNGVVTYSEVVKVKKVKDTPALYVFPNPVRNGNIQLQMNHALAGSYTTRLLNSNGQVISKKAISHAGGTDTKVIRPTQSLTNGNYQLEVSAPNSKVSVLKVIVAND
jgi:autotransporter-associated beta strand protein